MAQRLQTKDAFPATGPDGRYHAHLAELRSYEASGVYAILKGNRVLYVGESHTGRLYDTITRHFRSWRVDPANDRLGRRRGGTTYDRHASRVIYLITDPREAQDVQYAEIQRLGPEDNQIDCAECDLDVPF